MWNGMHDCLWNNFIILALPRIDYIHVCTETHSVSNSKLPMRKKGSPLIIAAMTEREDGGGLVPILGPSPRVWEAFPASSFRDLWRKSQQHYAVWEGVRSRYEGLVHVSQLRHKGRVQDVTDVVKWGQRVKVKIPSITGNKMSLSIKDVDQVTGHDLNPVLKTVIVVGVVKEVTVYNNGC